MHALILLLSLVSQADGFQWSVESPFSWSITEGGDANLASNGSTSPGTDVTDSGAVQKSDSAAPESFSDAVQLIEVYHDNSADSGSAVHLGDGVFVTCKHVFTDDAGNPWNIRFVRIAGRRVEYEKSLHPTRDIAIVKTSKRDMPLARVSESIPAAGQPLTVFGVKTETHHGVMSAGKWKEVMAVESATLPENGDSGAGVFNESGEVVGVMKGAINGLVYFTPMSDAAELLAIGSAAVSPPKASPAAEPSYSYCQCQSRGESACHCLKTGQVCHCPTNGPSKWEMADGRPVRKVPKNKPENAYPDTGGDNVPKPSITIVSPETWDCQYCPGHRNQDWSDFNVTFIQSDQRSKFPCTEWTDKNGVTRQLFGIRKPSAVMWSWKATQ